MERPRGKLVWLAAGVVVLLGMGAVVTVATGPVGTTRSSKASLSPSGRVTSASGQTSAASSANQNLAAAGTGGVADGSTPGQAVVPTLPAAFAAPTIVRTAEVAVRVGRGRFRTGFEAAAALATANGGFVASSSSHKGDTHSASGGTLVIRVPSDRFDAVRNGLAQLGTVTGEKMSGEDVSSQLVDLGARLQNLRAEEATIRGFLDKTRNVGETLTVQSQLSAVREQIEQLAAQQARLQDSVSFSTITASITEPGGTLKPREGHPAPLATSVKRAVHGAEAVIGGTIVVVGWALPLAVLAGLAYAGWRLFTRREAAAATAADAPG